MSHFFLVRYETPCTSNKEKKEMSPITLLFNFLYVHSFACNSIG